MEVFVLPHEVEHIKERRRRKTFSLSIIITVTEQRGWRAKRDQRKVERWPLAVETHPDDKVKDKLTQLRPHRHPPPPFAYSEPNLGFDALWKLHVLILPVLVAHLNKRHLLLRFLLVLKDNHHKDRCFTTLTVLLLFNHIHITEFMVLCCHFLTLSSL